MNSHKNALLTARGREPMVRAVLDTGLSVAAVARLYRTTPKTVGKWVARFRAEGVNGLCDRSSSAIHRHAKLRRQHAPPSTPCAVSAKLATQIAGEVGVSPATVSRVLRRVALPSLKNDAGGIVARTGLMVCRERGRLPNDQAGAVPNLEAVKLGPTL
jgi:transposase-like protein